MKLIALICALGNLGFLCAFTQTNARMNDTNNIEGTWSCVAATVDGKPLPSTTTDLLRLTLTKDRYKTEKGSEVLFDSTYNIDPSKNPKEINMVGTEGELTGKLAPGIFSYDGKTLRLCYVMPGLPRPKTFESPEGSKVFLVVWRRTSQ
ncbi:MAG: TIGR03067 domain-containing protein [Verrucomicrobiales bacterium]|nr:TIGR03067 domain-containing protein [Verrucomicrobiales bacterium]